MIDIINIAIALLTIGLGLFGLISPRYTASVMDLKTDGSTMGLSELRASAGGIFVATGLACLITGAPWAYLGLGVVYLGAGAGRITSIVIDKPPMPKAFVWFLCEWVPAAWLIYIHYPLV